MVRSAPAYAQDLIPNQCQQSWTRLSLIVFGVLYISWHGQLFSQYQNLCLSAVGIYIIWQLYTLIDIPRSPLSISRFLISPILDALLIAIGIMLDNGQNSGIFLCYFVMIMSNGVRFGNPMLLYSQALALLSYLFTCAFTYLHTHTSLDIPLLFLQLLSLLLLPYYIYIIGKHAKASFAAKKRAQSMSFDTLASSPAPIFTFQVDSDEIPRITYANTAMQHVYRSDVSSLIGEQVDILALMEDGNEIIKACQEAFHEQDHKPVPFYIRGRNANDQVLKIMGQTNSLYLQGKKLGICFLVDITHNESTRSDMEKNSHEGHVSTLVSGIAHDFRNILTSIIGSAEVMQFSTEDQAMIDQLGLIINAGERGSEMVSNLLSQSTSNEAMNLQDDRSIQQSLTSMVNLLRLQLPAHIQLQLHIEEPLPEVAISSAQLEQILMNLIKNSAESMLHAGCINIHLSRNDHQKLTNNTMPALHICVCDEGKGIAPEDLENVTQAFWTSRSDEGGTGLGLAMVQRIVRNHHGELDIQSTLGQGTKITISFPAITASTRDSLAHNFSIKEKHTETSHEIEDNSEYIIPWHILLVDDSPVVLGIHQHLLERMGHTITTAESAEAALALYEASLQDKTNTFDLIATDFRMGGMDGIDLIKYIRKHDTNLPILMITAYGDAKKFQQNKDLQIDVLHKPTSYKKLQATMIKLQQR